MSKHPKLLSSNESIRRAWAEIVAECALVWLEQNDAYTELPEHLWHQEALQAIGSMTIAELDTFIKVEAAPLDGELGNVA